jgi:hypothetical protein
MAVATIETRDYVNCGEAALALGLSANSVRKYCNNFEEGKTPSLKGMQIGLSINPKSRGTSGSEMDAADH